MPETFYDNSVKGDLGRTLNILRIGNHILSQVEQGNHIASLHQGFVKGLGSGHEIMAGLRLADGACQPVDIG